MLVAPRVFRVPEGPAAVCAGGRRPAREIATRELRSEWSISRPALALPPPSGTAARPCASKPAPALRSLRRPPHRRCCVADVVWRVVLTPDQAPPPPTGTAATPSGPSTPVAMGVLHYMKPAGGVSPACRTLM